MCRFRNCIQELTTGVIYEAGGHMVSILLQTCELWVCFMKTECTGTFI